MKFLVVSAAIALSLLATPGCKQLKCGKGTVEEDGKCVIPKPIDCAQIALSAEASDLYTLVKPELISGRHCSLVLKAKQNCLRTVGGEWNCELTAMQYDKDGVNLGGQELSGFSKLRDTAPMAHERLMGRMCDWWRRRLRGLVGLLVVAWLLLAITACGKRGRAKPRKGAATPSAVAGDSRQPARHRVDVIETRKVCQLTGETDVETKRAAHNRTLTRYSLWGTDLGTSFQHDGKTWLFFGDSHPSGRKKNRGLNPHCGEAMAHTSDATPSDCLDLTFVTHPGTKIFKSPTVEGFPLPCFGVPTGGISVGGKMYVWFAQIDEKPEDESEPGEAILSRSDDLAQSAFEKVYSFSKLRFLNVAAAVLPDKQAAGLPDQLEDIVMLFGSGAYRRSQIYLAAVPSRQIEDKSAVVYFTGLDASGKPKWSRKESKAKTVAPTGKPCVGELSVHYNEPLGLWVLLYNCRGRIVMQVAERPWGEWSAPQVVLDSKDARCKYLVNVCKSGKGRCCTDQALPNLKEGARGGGYGPYVLSSLTESSDAGEATIYWVLSTWVPYNTVLMRTVLQRP